MRGFAEYRKRELKSQIYTTPVRESVNCFLEALRIDLLQQIKLPEMTFEGNLTLNATYNHGIKDDYERNKNLIDSLITHYRNNLYPAIVEEAGAAVAATAASVNPYADFEKELIAKVTEMVKLLKQQITDILNSGRSGATSSDEDPNSSLDVDDGSTSTSNPASGLGGNKKSSSGSSGSGGSGPSRGSSGSSGSGFGGSSGSGGSGPSRGSSGSSGSGGSSGSAFSGSGPSHGSSGSTFSGFGPSRGSSGSFSSPSSSGFTPAPHGNFTPSDGILAGIKRLGGAMVPRAIRQAWHNDPNRPKGAFGSEKWWMSKEHSSEIGMLFLENSTAVMDIIDIFQRDLVTYIKDRMAVIATSSGNIPPSKAVRPPRIAGDSNSVTGNLPIDTTDDGAPAAGTGTSSPELGTDPKTVNLATGTPTPTEKLADAGNPVAQKKVNEAYENIRAALEALGMSFTKTEQWGMKAKRTPNVSLNDVLINGQPASQQLKRTGFIRHVIYGIYEHPKLMAKLLNPQQKNSKAGGKPNKKVFADVLQWLGVASTANMVSPEMCNEVLLKLGAKLRGGQPTGIPATSEPSNPVASNPSATSNPSMAPSNTLPIDAADPEEIGRNTGSRLKSPMDTQPTPTGSPTASTGMMDTQTFVNDFKKKHADVWNKWVDHSGEPEVMRVIEKKLGEMVPEELANKLVVLANKIPAKAKATVAPETQPTVPEEIPQGQTGESPEVAPEVPQGPELNQQVEPTVNKGKQARDQLISDLSSDPETKDLVSHLDNLSDDEITNIIGDRNFNDDEALGAVMDALLQKLSGDEEQPSSETGEVPSEEPQRSTEVPQMDQDTEEVPDVVKQALRNPESAEALRQFVAANPHMADAIQGMLKKNGADDVIKPERLQSPRRNDVQAPEAPAPATTPNDESAIEPLLNTPEYGTLTKKYRELLSLMPSVDDGELRHAMNKMADECEAIMKRGGTVQDALKNLQDKIKSIQIARQPDDADDAKTKQPVASSGKTKSNSKKKSGSKDDMSNLSPEELTRRANELLGTKSDDLERNPEELEADQEKEERENRRRTKKKLSEGFDTVINRFKKNLTEGKRDSLTASQRLIFS